jgi:MFS family permease
MEIPDYTQMLLLRMGVGVGEASLSPAAYSLITDYFPPHRLATAISVYSMGIYLGSGLTYLLGGTVIAFASGRDTWTLPVIGALRPWQVIFFLVGAVALTTDYVFRDDNSVGWSLLLIGCVAHVFSSLPLWRGLRPFRASLSRPLPMAS